MYRKTATLLALLLLVTASLAAAAGVEKKEDTGTWAKAYNDGVDLMQAGDYAAAQAKFEAALAAKEDFAEAHSNLGYSLRKQSAEHRDAALKHYNRALELEPKLAQALQYRGVLYVLMGDETKAKADHKTLVGLNKGLAEELMQVIATGEEPAGNSGLAPHWKQN